MKLFTQLQELEAEKIKVINEFLQFEVLVQVEELKGKFGGTDLVRIFQPNPGEALADETSSGEKRNQYKRNEDFLTARHKACPW